MSDQARRRRQLANLERMQEQRRAMVERRKTEMDAVVEKKDREIANLRATLQITVAPTLESVR